MPRYGWDYDRGYRDRGWMSRGFYGRDYDRFDERDRGRGWGMEWMNNAVLRGPRPEDRGYDHAIHGRPRRGGYDAGYFGHGPARGMDRPYHPMNWRDREVDWRGHDRVYWRGYDRGWF